MLNKFDELENIISSYQPHVLIITETWLHSGVRDSEVVPPSYRLLRKDRGSRGGGVAVAIKKNIKSFELDGIPDHESVWCKITYYDKSIIVGGVYRPPNAAPDYIEVIHDYLSKHTNSRSKIILAGDFNLPGINWNNGSHDGRDVASSELLLDVAFAFSLNQLVTDNTRITATSSSLLDLAFVSSTLEGSSASIENGISDHKSITLTCPISCAKKYKKPLPTYFKDYARANDPAVLRFLETQFHEFIELTDVKELWAHFKSTVKYCEDTFIPNKKKRINREYPWITREIIQLKRKIKRRQKKGTKNNVRDLIGTLKHKMSEAKTRFFNTTLASFMAHCPKKFWRYLSDERDSISQIKNSEQIIKDPEHIANEMNKFFQSVFTKHTSNALLPPYTVKIPMEELIVNEEGILSLLQKLDQKKSTGPDQITNSFLSRYANWTSKYLFKIYTLSLQTSQIPDDWCNAVVVPIHKSGPKLEISNYRPVSLTSSCCKIMEHVIFKAIITHLETNELLYKQQHGFRSGLSTITQLAELTHDIANAINDNVQLDAIFLDFSKAFDVVPHLDLVKKLSAFGIDIKIISWINNFLTKRKQSVKIDNQLSEPLDVYSGVPQGSVLAPLLFLMFINDIHFSVENPIQMRLFADDCVVYTVVRNSDDQTKLNNSLQAIYSWCNTWGMKLNTSKTHCISFTNKKSPLNYTYRIGNSIIEKCNQVKYLGITLTPNLNWEPHILAMCQKAEKKLSFLRRKLRNAPPHIKINAYKTLIRPCLEYADLIWSPHQKYLISKIERIQKLAVRFVYSEFARQSSTADLLARANLKQLFQRRIMSRLKFLYQLYHGHFHISRSQYLQDPPKQSFRLNHSKTIRQPLSRVNAHKHSLFPSAISLWNSLPNDIVCCSTIDSFINRIQCIEFAP